MITIHSTGITSWPIVEVPIPGTTCKLKFMYHGIELDGSRENWDGVLPVMAHCYSSRGNASMIMRFSLEEAVNMGLFPEGAVTIT